jgi:hypothetical protein
MGENGPPPLKHLAQVTADVLMASLPLSPRGVEIAEQVVSALARRPPMQAYELDKVLPRDLKLLMSVVRHDNTVIEVRGKILEVMLHRAAINEYAYDHMTAAHADTYEDLKEYLKREDEFVERRRYQEAVRDAVFADGRLFDQLSESKDQMRQGRSPGTEFMNTMLRNGGVYGTYESRQEFERRMQQLPAETRGRMMYHLLDAGHTSDIHLKGERRSTGDGWELSLDTGKGGVGLGFSESWEYVADNHWKEVGRDVTREMRTELADRPEEYLADHEKGLRDAAARDRGFE